MIVVTVSGRARHGKDTFGKLLAERFTNLGQKVRIVHFADYLKYIAINYYDWNGEKDEVGRKLLQQLGTEKVRSVNKQFWVHHLAKEVDMFANDTQVLIVPDARFPNEMSWQEWNRTVLNTEFYPIRVHVERVGFESDLTNDAKAHSSETALDSYKFDHYIKASNVEELANLTNSVVDEVISLQQEGW